MDSRLDSVILIQNGNSPKVSSNIFYLFLVILIFILFGEVTKLMLEDHKIDANSDSRKDLIAFGLSPTSYWNQTIRKYIRFNQL